VVAVAITDGFFQSRLVFDIIRRAGFSKEAVQRDRDREASLVAQRSWMPGERHPVVPANGPVSPLTGARQSGGRDMFVCERCRQGARVFTMSLFNEQMICIGGVAIEQAHPRFDEAVAAEEAAARRGDFNFPGIGLPEDVMPPRGGEIGETR
jgi:hypothetical protein